jgi:hypothetical protein
MSSTNWPRTRPKARRIVTVERLEERELLSYAGLYAHAALGAQHTIAQGLAASEASLGGPGSGLASFLPYAQVISATQGGPTPTTRELAREAFVAKFTGSYTSGPGRFTNQSESISFVAYGGSTSSFHMNIQGIIYIPADPNDNSVVGTATLYPRNVLTSGSQASVTLSGGRQPSVAGLPTQYTWTINNSNSGGIFLAPNNSPGAGGAYGTATVQFIPQRSAHGFSSGKVNIVFRGLIYTTGTLNPIGIPGNRAGQSELPNKTSNPAFFQH